MKTKIILIILSFIFLSNIISFSQDQRPSQRGDRFTELKTRLNLNDEQSEKVKEIFGKFQDEMQEVRNNSDLSREERMAKIREINDKMDIEIEKILTDEQKTEYAKFKEERLNRIKNRNQNQN